jgi:hypothetical protein
MAIEGRHDMRQDAYTMLQAFEAGDLYLSVGKGTGGLGDPLLRPVSDVEADLEGGHLLPRFAESVYGVSDRDAYRARRLARARPAAEWWASQRERVMEQALSDPVRVMFAESMRLSPEWAAEYRGFWDLPADFEFDVLTPTVPAAASAPGKVTPEEAVAIYLARATAFQPADGPAAVPVVTSFTRDELADLLDERLSRRAVKDIQSSIKDPDRFDKWVSLLSARVAYDDPIVLPYGEGLNIVRRRGDGGTRTGSSTRSCMSATRSTATARSTPSSATPTPSGRSCASTTARSRDSCSRPRRSRPATRSCTSSSPTSRASTEAGSGASCRDPRRRDRLRRL